MLVLCPGKPFDKSLSQCLQTCYYIPSIPFLPPLSLLAGTHLITGASPQHTLTTSSLGVHSIDLEGPLGKFPIFPVSVSLSVKWKPESVELVAGVVPWRTVRLGLGESHLWCKYTYPECFCSECVTSPHLHRWEHSCSEKVNLLAQITQQDSNSWTPELRLLCCCDLRAETSTCSPR